MSEERRREKDRPPSRGHHQQRGGQNCVGRPEERNAARGKAKGEPHEAAKVVRGGCTQRNRKFGGRSPGVITELADEISRSNLPQDRSALNIHARPRAPGTGHNLQQTRGRMPQISVTAERFLAEGHRQSARIVATTVQRTWSMRRARLVLIPFETRRLDLVFERFLVSM